MLYDPRWEKKPEPKSIRGLIAWLETQRAGETYHYCDPHNCLAAQYCKHIGISYRIPGLLEFLIPTRENRFRRAMESIANNGGRAETFGEALVRARMRR